MTPPPHKEPLLWILAAGAALTLLNDVAAPRLDFRVPHRRYLCRNADHSRNRLLALQQVVAVRNLRSLAASMRRALLQLTTRARASLSVVMIW
jgi:hypothetical protein